MSVTSMYSEVESNRFGFRVFRFTTDRIDEELMDEIIKKRPDLAIIRIPASEITRVQILGKLGVNPIVADTLVYYRRKLEPGEPMPIRNTGLEFKLSGMNSKNELETLTRMVFKGYSNHYMANPLIDRSWLEDGYVEWAVSYLNGDGKHFCWMVHDGPEVAAFITGRRNNDEFEDVLGGVHPGWRRRSLYGDLLSCTMAFAADLGCRSILVSTQVDNIAVQRTWTGRRFVLERSVNTIHLNLFPGERT